MTPPHVVAIILAAGRSSRMGRLKPLLPLAERTVIERLVSVFHQAGVADVGVVVGYRGGEIAQALRDAPVRIIENAHFDRGMYSSVQAGVRAFDPVPDGLFVLPADIPLVRPWTLQCLMHRFSEDSSKVVHPCLLGERGHPPLLPGSLVRQIAEDTVDTGLHRVLEANAHRNVDQEVADRYILIDVDTPGDYESLLNQWRRYPIPDDRECRVMVSCHASDPQGIWRHGQAVAHVAGMICGALKAGGCDLDAELIRGAALVHDIAKGRQDHARAGAKLIGDMGFAPVAGIVACHMEIALDPQAPVSEAEVVYMADKYVQGDRRVSMDARFDKAMERFGADEEARRHILRRRATATAVRDRMERLIGRPLAGVLDLNDPSASSDALEKSR
ncbi:MAG: NTP transferase domain-containing protein [Desulfobacterales bacterium]|nr:NTP transferase domain-containing protein [Desulfobacterales bacterium]